MKKLLLFTLFLCYFASGFTQVSSSDNYDWEIKPTYPKAEESNEDFYYQKYKRIIEYVYVEDTKEFYKNLTVHYIIKLNTEKAISQTNKVYISLNNVVDIKEIKARVITKDNKITEVDKNNIKEVENIDNKGAYKLFALEGLEKESVIEVFYKVKKEASLYGTLNVEGSVTKKNFSFELIAPSRLYFKAKVYNAVADAVVDTVIDNISYLKYDFDSIPPPPNEKYSSVDANAVRIDFSFIRNLQISDSELYTYPKAAVQIYDAIYSDAPKIIKKIKKEVGKMKISKKSTEEKVVLIEDFVKKNYSLRKESNGENIGGLTFAYKNKYTDENGMARVFVAYLNAAGVKHNLVLTADRFKRKFDKDFMMWANLSKMLIYFPELDAFLIPSVPTYRYPFIPFNYIETEALLIKKIEIGDAVSALAKFISIPANNFEEDYHNTEVEVSINDDFSSVKLNIKQIFAGISALQLYPYYNLMEDSKKSEFAASLLEGIAEDLEIQEKDIQTIETDVCTTGKEFIVGCTGTSNSVIEKAGNSYIIKIGDLIGPQSQLYDTTERKTPVEQYFLHSLKRKITLNIPVGYKVKGLESVMFNVECGNEEEKIMGFVSNYTQDNNVVVIDIYEYYKQIFYDVDEYKNYREVINSASDFNKIALVLEKE